MSLILNQTMDYKNLLSQSSRVYRRVRNLAFGENPDKNMIFFRPLKICQGDHAELVFRVKENKIPFFAEIGTYGLADDTPSDVIVINHTETVIRFEGVADHAYEITVEIADRPGPLASVTALLAENGVSIKNIGITHNREAAEGTMSLEFYEETAMNRALTLLTQAGFEVKSSF